MIGLTLLLVRERWRSYLIVAWLAAVIGALAAAGALYPPSVADRVAEDEVRVASLSSRYLTLGGSATSDDFTRVVTRARTLPRFTVIYNEQIPVVGDGFEVAQLLHRDGACAHIRIIAGRCPVAGGEVALPEPQLARLKLGDQTAISLGHLTSAGWVTRGLGEQPVGIVGVYAPLDPAEDYWGSRSLFGAATDLLSWPMLTVPATLGTVPHPVTNRSMDLMPDHDLLISGDYAEVRRLLADARIGEPDTGMRALMDRIAAKRRYTSLMTPVVVAPVLALGLWALLIVVGSHLRRDRQEAGVPALRGLPVLRRWWLMLGAPVLLVVVLTPAGAAVVVASSDGPGGPAAVAALYATLAALAFVVAAGFPLIRARVTDALRSVPSRRPGGGVAEVALTALAVAALLQLRSGDRSGLGLYAATLSAAAVAVLAARLVPLLLRRLTGPVIRRGFVTTGVALALFTRRDHGRQLLALTGLTIALLALVSTAVGISSTGRKAQATWESGAARVLTIRGNEAGPLLAWVGARDPQGRYAVVVGRIATTGGPPVLAMDLSRPDALRWDRARQVAEELVAPAAPAVRLVGGTVSVDLDLAPRSFRGVADPGPEAFRLSVSVEDDRYFVADVDLGALRPGRSTYTAPLPGTCAVGCRVAALSVSAARDTGADITVHSLRSAAGAVTDLGAWHRPRESRHAGALTVGVIAGADEVTWLLPPDAVQSVPAVFTAGQSTSDRALAWRVRAKHVTSVVTATGAGEEPVLPRLGNSGTIVDLVTAYRATAGGLDFTALELWLTAEAPDEIADQLTGAGFRVTGDQRLADVLRAEELSPAVLTLRMHRVAAVVGVGLLISTIGFAVAGARQAPDLAALRAAGLSRRRLRRAVRLTYLAVLALGVVVGVGAAALAWLVARAALPTTDRPSWLPEQVWPEPSTVLLPLGVAVAVLALAVCLVSGLGRRSAPV
ncbi:hypothetical protein F4553_005871 [Allocatelliglobosispora scoriae]|uniref:FtsX-like permease family protein n=1 Tax=Allocatelliglobosispora scoriae TaxID=643052 RepID=A0A841BTN0_9ACTN|nr:hypothetical protein [Allocatelliglobosispora scoriae]MBB5872437.1 hypothetical protein [Allocatelliglobosispora scoriae]